MLIEPVRSHIKDSFFSSSSDLMKSTVEDESLSTNATRVMFQKKTTLLLQPKEQFIQYQVPGTPWEVDIFQTYDRLL